MKTPFHSMSRWLATAAVGAACVLALPQEADARDRHYSHDRYDRGRSSYFGFPSSRFVVTFGTGYAGRGYYYGPPGVPYYYQAPGVRYYRSRSVVPSHYWGGHSVSYRGSTDARVQAELARRGYYRGPIDGDIGPGSRAAIARFQADRGLAVTGYINTSLLSALGVY